MLGKLAFLATERLRGSQSLNVLREIANEPHLDREVVLQRQFERLSKLLAHAEQRVPYYREVFRERRITSQDIRSLADLKELPVLTKSIVRERQRDLISDNVDPSTLHVHHSGGSTGQPLTFYHDRSSIAASDAGTYRNMLQAGWRPGDMVAFFWGWNSRLYSMPPIEFEARQWLRRQYQFDSFRAGDEAFTQWIRTWRRIRPKLVYGYASAIARFAEYLIREQVSLPPVRGVFTTAETLLPQQRSAMEQAFGCKVFDCYGSSEVRNIAAQCTAGGMHVNADFALLEVLRDPREVVEPETGPFAVTSLRSFAMPFIRYQNDDCGALLDAECRCGGGFPLMRLDIARTSDHFLMPNGALVHGLFFIHRLYGSTGVANFQFHQVSPHHIVLYIVRAQPSDGFVESIARAISDINRLSPVPLTIEVREVSSIPLSAAGKHRYVRSDVSHSVPR